MKIIIGKYDGKTPLGTHLHTWKDSIKMDCREIGLEVLYSSHVTQDKEQGRALVKTVMSLRVP
jgi:hypothetical protein